MIVVDQLQFQELETAAVPSMTERGGRRLLPRAIVAALAALVVGGLVGWLVGQSGDSGSAPSDAMIETVDTWHAAVEAQDPGSIAELYAEDAVWYDEALDDRFTSRDAIRSAWAIFGGIDTATVEQLAIDDETAALSWTFIGPNGLDLTGISVLELDGATIVGEIVYYDCAQSPVASWACDNS